MVCTAWSLRMGRSPTTTVVVVLVKESLDQVVVELIEVREAETEGEENHKAFLETADIADVVEEAVDVAVDAVQVQVEFEGDLQVHVVGELVRPRRLVLITKYPAIVLRQRAELVVVVL